MNLQYDFIDFPTGWEIQNSGILIHTDRRCSAEQTGGGMLCDCGALEKYWEAIKAVQKAREISDSMV